MLGVLGPFVRLLRLGDAELERVLCRRLDEGSRLRGVLEACAMLGPLGRTELATTGNFPYDQDYTPTGAADSYFTGVWGFTPFAAEGSNGPNSTLYILREGIERFFIKDINNPAASAMAQSEIMTMFDNLSAAGPNQGAESSGVGKFNHVPGGCNVLYMDGHVGRRLDEGSRLRVGFGTPASTP